MKRRADEEEAIHGHNLDAEDIFWMWRELLSERCLALKTLAKHKPEGLEKKQKAEQTKTEKKRKRAVAKKGGAGASATKSKTVK